MDKKVITKIIKFNGVFCPHFKYENPLLDKNIADLLAKGFIKLLNNQTSDNDINDNNRHMILTNIRKSCKIEPQNHLYMDDNITEVLKNAYEDLPNNQTINKDLETFLIRNMKEININSLHSPSFEPDIVQALLNLNKDKREINNILAKDIIYWNMNSKENSYLEILKTIWNIEFLNGLSKTQADDISIKIKPLIEMILLPCALEMLNTVIVDEDDWFSENKDLIGLVEICCASSECFQICCSIMNSLFIKTKFDIQMNGFITLFINYIKNNVKHISRLYSTSLQHIVVLLDIDLNELSEEVQMSYTAHTLKYLNSLHEECESDLIMLLSHFNNWFDIYYKSKL